MGFYEKDLTDLLHDASDTSAVAVDGIPPFVLRQKAKVLSQIMTTFSLKIILAVFDPIISVKPKFRRVYPSHLLKFAKSHSEGACKQFSVF